MRPISNWPSSACDGMPKISTMRARSERLPSTPRPLAKPLSVNGERLDRRACLLRSADQRTITVLQRAERFVRRNRGALSVIVTRIFGLFGLLHFEEIGGMNLAAIGADRALAEQRVVRWHLLHFSNDDLAVFGAFEFGDCFQVMRDCRVDAGVNHGREFAGPLDLPALRPCAVGVIHVPIPSFGEHEALGHL